VILADTGALLAAIDPLDDQHAGAASYLRDLRRPSELVVPGVVLAELTYWVEVRLGTRAEAALLRRLAQGAWRVEHFIAQDLLRAADLVEQYADFPLGTVDSLLVAIAERLNVTTLFTLDRRHFGSVRPTHCEAFELVPRLS
jgi:hypothetical protein